MTDTHTADRVLCATHRHGEAEPAPGLRICWPCANRIHHHVTDLARLWRDITTLTAPGATAPRGGGRRGPNSSAPTDLDALDTKNATADLITSWCRLVADERGFKLPHPHIPTRITWLASNTDWLAAHETIADFASEIAHARTQLRSLAGEALTRIAWCQEPHPDPQIDGPCGGPLIHYPGSVTPVRCGDCGADWTAGAIQLAIEQLTHTTSHTA